MRSVALEAGVTPMALYRHFENKEELLRAVVREAYAVFLNVLDVPLPGSDPAVWLRMGFDRYLHFALEHRNYYELLFVMPHGIGIDRYPKDFEDGRSKGFGKLRDIVARCMQAGALRDDAPGDVALTLYAHMHGLVMLHFGGRYDGDAAVFGRFYHDSLERVVRGLQ